MSEYDWQERTAEELRDWLLCSELTVMEAALLTIWLDPAGGAGTVESLDMENRPAKYELRKRIISRGLRRGEIEGSVYSEAYYDEDGTHIDWIPNSVDPEKSRVEIESLRDWMREKRFPTNIFLSEPRVPDYLNPEHPCYPPKLAIAIEAWEAVSSEFVRWNRGVSPKQLVEAWLTKHADRLGLRKANGVVAGAKARILAGMFEDAPYAM